MENVKKVGFFKLGKAIKFNENSWGAIGGDCEPKQLINSIAKSEKLTNVIKIGKVGLDGYINTIKDYLINLMFEYYYGYRQEM